MRAWKVKPFVEFVRRRWRRRIRAATARTARPSTTPTAGRRTRAAPSTVARKCPRRNCASLWKFPCRTGVRRKALPKLRQGNHGRGGALPLVRRGIQIVAPRRRRGISLEYRSNRLEDKGIIVLQQEVTQETKEAVTIYFNIKRRTCNQ